MVWWLWHSSTPRNATLCQYERRSTKASRIEDRSFNLSGIRSIGTTWVGLWAILAEVLNIVDPVALTRPEQKALAPWHITIKGVYRSFHLDLYIVPQTGTVGVLNSYYNGSMDKMIWGHDLTPADPQSLEGQHDLTPLTPAT